MKKIQNWKLFNENVESDTDIVNPKFTDKNAEDFLTRLGVSITKATGEYKPGVPEEPNVDIRKWPTGISYGFKIEKDYDNFQKFVSDNNIPYKTMDSPGARYPYHVVIKKG